jgi:hypothetical protein
MKKMKIHGRWQSIFISGLLLVSTLVVAGRWYQYHQVRKIESHLAVMQGEIFLSYTVSLWLMLIVPIILPLRALRTKLIKKQPSSWKDLPKLSLSAIGLTALISYLGFVLIDIVDPKEYGAPPLWFIRYMIDTFFALIYSVCVVIMTGAYLVFKGGRDLLNIPGGQASVHDKR